MSRWSVPFEFSFCEGKTRFTHAIAANKRANSDNLKIKKIEATFTRCRTNFPLDILFTRNRAKVSFCSDGTDNRMKFVTLVSGFTISSCTQSFFSKWRPEREKPIRMVARITNISLGRMRRQHYCLMLLYHI